MSKSEFIRGISPAGVDNDDAAMDRANSVALDVTPTWAISFAAILIVAGCASRPTVQPRKDLLDFLVDGRTSCGDLSGHLGSPSRQYEGGHVLTYAVTEDGQGRYSVVPPHDWSRAHFSLVLSCGSDGILVRHALVAVKEEP